MSDFEIEAISLVHRKVTIKVTSDDGMHQLAAGSVGTSQYGALCGPPMLTLAVHYEANEGVWQKIRTAVDEAFKLYKETF